MYSLPDQYKSLICLRQPCFGEKDEIKASGQFNKYLFKKIGFVNREAVAIDLFELHSQIPMIDDILLFYPALLFI